MGLLQTWASVEHGYWFARSAEFMQTGRPRPIEAAVDRPEPVGLPGAVPGAVAMRRERL
jgi:hypothetical protein